jgi:hypothetical protein
MIAQEYIENVIKRPPIMRIAAGAGVAVFAGGSALVAFNDPTASHILPVCPLYVLTGFACPGCGLTRGFHAFFHGDILTALHFNALLPVWALIFAWSVVSLGLLAVRGKTLSAWWLNPRFLWTFFFVLVTFGVLRNLPMYPFTLLFP